VDLLAVVIALYSSTDHARHKITGEQLAPGSARPRGDMRSGVARTCWPKAPTVTDKRSPTTRYNAYFPRGLFVITLGPKAPFSAEYLMRRASVKGDQSVSVSGAFPESFKLFFYFPGLGSAYTL
jgi:hypothetical protein